MGDQLGLDAPVGHGDDHRRRSRPTARSGLQRLSVLRLDPVRGGAASRRRNFAVVLGLHVVSRWALCFTHLKVLRLLAAPPRTFQQGRSDVWLSAVGRGLGSDRLLPVAAEGMMWAWAAWISITIPPRRRPTASCLR